MKRPRVLFILALGGSACASASAPAKTPPPVPVAVVSPVPPPTDAADADAGAPAETSKTPDAPPPNDVTLPASDFTSICYVGHSGGEDMFIAVKDEGNAPTIAMATAEVGPFHVVVEDPSTKPFKMVIEGKALQDADLQASFKEARVKPAKLTVYAVGIRGGWSFGMAVATNNAGAVLAKGGWAMKPGLARPCSK